MDKIKDICIFASSERIVLPKLTEEKIYLSFTPEKQKIFNEFKNDYMIELQNKEIAVLSKQILINKCLQLSNGCIYHDRQHNYMEFDDGKLQFVKKYSEDHPEENLLVFYCYKFDKERLLRLDGAQAIHNNETKNKWNKGEIKIGVISPYSFQYGGNLQYGGYTVIWFGLMWGLENYLQSNKRVYRQGQKHEVKIMYLLTKNTWDDYVYHVVIAKDIDQKDFLDKIDMRKV